MNNDLFGHSQLGGAGKMLETIIKERFGYKARSIELNTPQRCAAHISSGTDIEESFMIGAAGANAAISGESGKMMCYERKDSDIYSIDVVTRDISQIANEEKKVPKVEKISFYSSVDQGLKNKIFELEVGKNDIFVTRAWGKSDR